MPKVHMITTYAGPKGNYSAGGDYDLPGPLATELVSCGAAKWSLDRTIERAVVEVPEVRAEAVDLSAMSKAELVALAEERGVEVVRQDGEDGIPLKSDYVAALS